MNETKLTHGDPIDLEEINVIMKIPVGSAFIKMQVTMVDAQGNVSEVETMYSTEEIRQMRQDFLDNVECGDEYDARYVLTEKGRQYLEELRKLEAMS